MSRHFRRLAITAHHEAAHAVVSIVVDQPFRFATIVPCLRLSFLGVVDYNTAYNDDAFVTCDKDAISTLAGAHAQRRFAPRSRWLWDARSDHQHVRAQVRKEWRFVGKRAAEKFAELDALAEQAVARNWSDIVKVAAALLERRTLTEDEVREVIGRRARKEPWENWTPRPGIIHPYFESDEVS